MSVRGQERPCSGNAQTGYSPGDDVEVIVPDIMRHSCPAVDARARTEAGSSAKGRAAWELQGASRPENRWQNGYAHQPIALAVAAHRPDDQRAAVGRELDAAEVLGGLSESPPRARPLQQV